MNVTNGVLTRKPNFRPGRGEPCIGATNISFDQVGTKKAVFRQEGADGLIREDRYLDTGCLDDYYMLFICLDRAGARKGRCSNYAASIGIRVDPPRNFPWDKAIHDLKRLGQDTRDFKLLYVDETKEEIVCTTCGKTFKSKRSVRQHDAIVHKNEGPFQCCGIQFRSSSHLTRHRCSVHQAEKMYDCPKCHKKFAINADLQRHIRREERRLQFKCDTCNSQFETRREMEEHVKTHDTVYVYDPNNQCPVCYKPFSFRTNMYRHMKTHK